MIARFASSSGAICLGCRLRLLRQAIRPYRHSPSPILDQGASPRWFASEVSGHVDEAGIIRSKDKNHSSKDVSGYKGKEPRDEEPLSGPDQLEASLNLEAAPPVREENFRAVKRLNFRKKHLSGSRVLTEATESLGSDMLGKPAYAIVMRDGGLFTRKNRSVEEGDATGEGDKREYIDINGLLLHQKQPPTDDEVRDNINELRPEREIYLDEREFRKIQHELENSFLKAQLSNYIKMFKSESSTEMEPGSKVPVDNDPSKAKDLAVPKFEWITKTSPWIPLGSDEAITDQTDRHLYGYVSPTAKAKERLAVRIMRECWGLHMEELSIGLGEVRLTLREHEFVLLLRGTRRFLNLLNELYLEPGESIAAIRSKHVIRIVAKRTTSQTIIEELDATLQQIKTSTFPVSYVTPDPTKIDAALLEEVGRLTNTHVRFSNNGKRIHVTWLEVRKSGGFEVEDLRHAVVRFLVTALKPNADLRILHVPDYMPDERQGRYLVDHYNQEKWAWKDRMGKWARFACPIAASESKSSEMPINADQKNLAQEEKGEIDGPLRELKIPIEHSPPPRYPVSEPLRVLTVEELPNETSLVPGDSARAADVTFHESSRFPYQPVRWSPDLTTITTAVFGHVLHPYPPTSPSLAGLKATHPRVFSPVVPHPMHLAQLDPQLEKYSLSPITSTILIRLRANPSPTSPILAPPLELRLSVSDSNIYGEEPQITGIHSLRAITTTHVHDVLLPSHPVDIRITQTQSALLQGSLSDMELWQPIKDFLSKARLDLSGGKLEVPPSQRFQIPRRLFTEPSNHKAPPNNQKKWQKKEGSNGNTAGKVKPDLLDAKPDTIISTNYEFAGLELHRSASVPHPDNHAFTLTYTSIEAGQSGGRRAELSLRPVPMLSPAPRHTGSNTDTSPNLVLSDANSGSTSQEVPDAITGSDSSEETRETTQQQQQVGDSSQVLHDAYLRACYKFARTPRLWSGHIMDDKTTKI